STQWFYEAVFRFGCNNPECLPFRAQVFASIFEYSGGNQGALGVRARPHSGTWVQSHECNNCVLIWILFALPLSLPSDGGSAHHDYSPVQMFCPFLFDALT